MTDAELILLALKKASVNKKNPPEERAEYADLYRRLLVGGKAFMFSKQQGR